MITKLHEMVSCAKAVLKEQAAMDRANAKSMDFDRVSIKRRHAAMEAARECAITIRTLRHEMHCLAVELGVADERDDTYYADSTAPCGFGRTTIFSKRRPKVQS